jgi:hypothetical protein
MGYTLNEFDQPVGIPLPDWQPPPHPPRTPMHGRYCRLEPLDPDRHAGALWEANALNAPSRQAAERLGFRFEGVFRQAAVYKGRNRDTAWFSIIDSEWPALHEAFQQWLAPANFDAEGRQRRRVADLIASERPATA